MTRANQQLELRFDGSVQFTVPLRRERRIRRAAWWFAQMHLAVERALAWRPPAPPRPEQVSLPLRSRAA